jgi:hypothetical protein
MDENRNNHTAENNNNKYQRGRKKEGKGRGGGRWQTVDREKKNSPELLECVRELLMRADGGSCWNAGQRWELQMQADGAAAAVAGGRCGYCGRRWKVWLLRSPAEGVAAAVAGGRCNCYNRERKVVGGRGRFWTQIGADSGLSEVFGSGISAFVKTFCWNVIF